MGEEYKCIWPDQQEFVRIVARFGATIVPFGAVGEDDIADLVLDYEDLMKILVLNDFIKENSHDINIRDAISGEVANQQLFVPGLLPKVPGHFYYLFGKPIRTKGKQDFPERQGKCKPSVLAHKIRVVLPSLEVHQLASNMSGYGSIYGDYYGGTNGRRHRPRNPPPTMNDYTNYATNTARNQPPPPPPPVEQKREDQPPGNAPPIK
ncbi:hypothetical protein Ddye_025450 [Dipteronia dyeriana]|uniref:Uncharacterized protein n=1 Tax=Dipteronia dyeriana TaxID=168575 RepID=A0AAD9TK86_9ROSI|nr:hypothetical protein Ddye_025450 [Dipteronia dyeriana]